MIKKLILLIVATIAFEPLFVSSALATRTNYLHLSATTHHPGFKKAQSKELKSRYQHHSPLTKETKNHAQNEQKTTVNVTCLILAGMLVVLPSFGLLASALSWGVAAK